MIFRKNDWKRSQLTNVSACRNLLKTKKELMRLKDINFNENLHIKFTRNV